MRSAIEPGIGMRTVGTSCDNVPTNHPTRASRAPEYPMLFALFWIIVGIVIGWNLPQPDWAKQIQERVVSAFKTITGGK
jgi:hypothetical protein